MLDLDTRYTMISQLNEHGLMEFIENIAHDYFEEDPEWDPLFIAYDKAVSEIEGFLRKQGVEV